MSPLRLWRTEANQFQKRASAERKRPPSALAETPLKTVALLCFSVSTWHFQSFKKGPRVINPSDVTPLKMADINQRTKSKARDSTLSTCHLCSGNALKTHLRKRSWKIKNKKD
uniref:Uncharacterized protein n=1 Tax=Anguilla anguilla TaxID=7936 RepID=A0A0E9X2J3_ANGAN